MLKSYLTNALKQLDTLIELTNEDIALVKAAKHDELSNQEGKKHHALVSFESTKSLLNSELLKLTTESGLDLSEVLSKEEGLMLESFKVKLQELKDTNITLSSMVIALNEFYGSLFDRMFKFDNQGYTKTKPLPAAMLRVSA
jgi:hypothetical protein